MTNILRDIGELGTQMDLNTQHEHNLIQACRSCHELLEECEKLVQKYSSVQNNNGHRFKVRRAWTRIRVDLDELRRLRERMSLQVSQLNLLQDTIAA